MCDPDSAQIAAEDISVQMYLSFGHVNVTLIEFFTR